MVQDGSTAVIPAFNEAGRISEVVRGALSHVDEVIVVDDASEDRTEEVAGEAGARVVRNERNLGYIGSVKRGFREASYRFVVTLDADGEHLPGDIPRLLGPLVEDRADVVFGMRDEVPRPSERLINRLVRGRAGGLRDTGTGFKALRREYATRLSLDAACTCGVLALELASMGARFEGVPVGSGRTDKPRRVAWEHLGQTFRVLGMLMGRRRRT
jgi:glycosyltransferase involved in cell wall biosynthesis